MILLWLNYLTKPQVNKEKIKIRFYCLPSKTKLYTVVKAPMAHKTNSKEQFISKIYFFKIVVHVKQNITINQKKKLLLPSKLSDVILTVAPFFETNLLFNQTYKITLPLLLPMYFKIHK